jgi:hypothetical protein
MQAQGRRSHADTPVVAALVLSEEEWDSLLIEGSIRRTPPFNGSRCDAWRYGCAETADRLLVGTRLGLCDQHFDQLHERAGNLGVTLQPSTRLVYVTTNAEGHATVWKRRGDQWEELRDPPVVHGRGGTRTERR